MEIIFRNEGQFFYIIDINTAENLLVIYVKLDIHNFDILN